jgi:uncharacterized protein (DUF362 family)
MNNLYASKNADHQIRVSLAGVPRNPSKQTMGLAVRSAAEAATDFSWLSKGDAVFIKPAHNSHKPYPSTTLPGAVSALIGLLKEKGAGRVIVGDMSGVQSVKLTPKGVKGSTRRLMAATGMAEAVEAAGGELHFFEEAGWDAFYEDLPAAGAHWQRGLMMPGILKAIDHIILMPRCARHVIAGTTLGMKTAVGYWRTDTRLEYHRYASTIHEKTAEANTVTTLLEKQRLVLSAADKILATFGPDDGHVIEPETGLVVASESIVAHDMVSLAWLIENRRVNSHKDRFRDGNRLLARLANRFVVSLLSGWGTALVSETQSKDDLNAVWDDKVLNHAYRVFGGLPSVVIEAVNDQVAEDLEKRLQAMTIPPD